MNDLSDFERFEPMAWQHKGMVRPLAQKRARVIRRKQSLPILLVVPLLGVGVATEQCIARVDYGATTRDAFALSQAHRRSGPDIDKRLIDIGDLKEGWHDGEGLAFDRASLVRLRNLLIDLPTSPQVPFPYLYPDNAGDISAEWTFGDWEVSLDFDPAVTRVAALAINTWTREKERMEIRLDAANASTRLARFIERYHRTEHPIA